MPSPKVVIEEIRKIRFQIGLDTENLRDDQKAALRDKEKVIKDAARLAREIDTKTTQFIFELIQNAEDNDYEQSEAPKIKFISLPDRLIIQNNEKGFQRENVWALCGVGESTKEKALGYIGEKGIGFKSVFMISDNPHIYSNGFRFQFKREKEKPESIIIPHWINDLKPYPSFVDPTQTNIVLPLKPEEKSKIKQYIDQIHPSLLLFLKKLKIIEIEDKIQYRHENRKIKRYDHNGLIEIEHGEKKSYWRAIKKTLEDIPEQIKEERLRGIHSAEIIFPETDLILAFPLNDDGSADASKEQSVFAFLPIRKYGFKFIIQADFLLIIGREDIIKDNEWNKWLRDSIVLAFLDAVNEFKVDKKLRYTFYNYLHLDEVKDEFFLPIVEQIYKKLQNTECILTETNQWKKPLDVFIDDEEIRKLVSNEDLKNFFGKEYQSTKIKPTQILRRLSVEKFSIEKLIKCLENTEWVKKQNDDWFAFLYEYLSKLSKQKLSDAQLKQLKGLDIIRLENEELTSVNDDAIFLPLDEKGKDYGFENELRIIKRDVIDIISGRERQEKDKILEFLKKLDIEYSNPYEIIEKYILRNVYKNDEWTQKDSATLLGYVKYIKDNISACEEKAYILSNLKLYLRIRVENTAEGTIGYELPEDIYLPKIYGNENDLETLFEGIDVNFVHPCYIDEVLKESEEKINSLKSKLKGKSKKWRKKHKKEVEKIEEQIKKSEQQRNDKIEEWRDFFSDKLGVNKSLIVKKDPKTRTYQGPDYAEYEVTRKKILKREKEETVWKDCDWNDTDWRGYYIHDDWISKDFNRIIDDSDKRYLFSWGSIPGNDNEKLLKYLQDDLDINWVENAKIYKSEDGKTIIIRKNIRLFQFDKKLKIMIDEEMEKATLKIGDDRTHYLKVIKENDKLNLYGKHNEEAKSYICKQLVNIIDANWGDFKEYKSCKYYYREYQQRGWSWAETPSTFLLTLKKESWLPTTQNTIVTPSQIFLNKPEIQEVLGDTVPYLAVEIKNEGFVKTLGINTEASVKNVLNYLKALAEQGCDDKSKFNRLYEFLNGHFDEDRYGIKRTLSDNALIYIPNTRKKFFNKDEVLWEDVSVIFGANRGYLKGHYPDLEYFFVEKLGVSEKPLSKHYADVLVDLSQKEEITSEDGKIILKIYEELNYHLNPDNVEENISEEDWWKDFIKERIFFTENNRFMRNDGDIFINDNQELYNLFKDHDSIAFLKLPKNYYPKIKYFVEAAGTLYLSKEVDLSLIDDAGKVSEQDLTDQIQKLTPYILRYLYKFEYETYKTLKDDKDEGALPQLKNLACYSVESLQVKYKLKGQPASPEQPPKAHLYNGSLYIQKDHLEDFDYIAVELSKLFGELRGLDDFLISLFDKKTEDKIKNLLRAKNIQVLPEEEQKWFGIKRPISVEKVALEEKEGISKEQVLGGDVQKEKKSGEETPSPEKPPKKTFLPKTPIRETGTVITERQIRNSKLANLVKESYSYHCQICLSRENPEILTYNKSYAGRKANRKTLMEAHHIKEVARYQGHDHPGNYLSLCKHHHDFLHSLGLSLDNVKDSLSNVVDKEIVWPNGEIVRWKMLTLSNEFVEGNQAIQIVINQEHLEKLKEYLTMIGEDSIRLVYNQRRD